MDEHHCRDCGHGRWPYDDKLSCYDLEVQYMKWSSPLSVGPIVIAVLGTHTHGRPTDPGPAQGRAGYRVITPAPDGRPTRGWCRDRVGWGIG